MHIEISGILVKKQTRNNSKGKILFVHGMFGSDWYWEQWMKLALNDNWDVYVINLPGHHESKISGHLGQQSVNDYIATTTTVVQELKIDIVVGHSMGGLIAQKIASLTQLRAAIFITSAAPKGITVLSWKLLKTMSKYTWPMLTNKPFIPSKKDLQAFFLNNTSDQEIIQFALSMFAPESGKAARELAFSLIPVSTLKCPSLVMGGTRDIFTPLWSQKKIAKKFKADFFEIDSGHMPMIEPNYHNNWKLISEWLTMTLI